MNTLEIRHKHSFMINIKDLDIYLSEFPYRRQLYFDSKDAIEMILGIEGFYINNIFNREKFNSDAAFVQSLVFDGILGDKIKMFLPHREEFFHNLTLNFGSTFSREMIENFLIETQIGQEHRHIFSNKIVNEKMVRESVEKGDQVYKIALCVDKPYWKERLKYLFRDTNIFDLKLDININTESIIESKTFAILNSVLTSIRPIKKENSNLYDAYALTCLQVLVERFNKNESNIVPIFYDSIGTLTSAIKKANLVDSFCVKLKSGNKNFIIRDSRYFISCSIFSKYEYYRDQIPNDNIIQEVSSYHSEIINYYSNNHTTIVNNLLQDNINDISVKISEYRQYEFFNKEIIKSKQSIIEKFKEHFDYDLYYNTNFQEQLDESLEKIRSDIERDVIDFIYIRDVFSKIKPKIIQSRKEILRITSNRIQGIDIVRDFGLIRFPIPYSLFDSVKHKVGDRGILSLNDDTSELAINDFSNNLVRAILGERINNSIIVVLSGLWIFRMYDQIINLIPKSFLLNQAQLSNSDFQIFNSIISFKAAALLETQYDEQELLELIELLERKNNSFNILIILSYLYFHNWLEKTEENFSYLGIIPTYTQLNPYLSKAILYAKQAYLLTREKATFNRYDKLLNIYALNIYIYFRVEGLSIDLLENNAVSNTELKEEGKKLINIRNKYNELWQYRFDDTIARYYHRKSIYEEKPELKLEWAEIALDFIIDAEKTCNDDPEVTTYKLILKDYLLELKSSNINFYS